MADMTSILTMVSSDGIELPNIYRYRCIDLNFGATANASMLATGTHNVMTLNRGEAITGGHYFVYTACTSTSNDGTIQFKVGSDALGAAMTADGTELAAGDVITLGTNDYEDAAGVAMYAKTAADTLDMVIATHAFTAGRILLAVQIVNIQDLGLL